MAPNVYSTGPQGQGGVWSSLENDAIRVDPSIEEQLRDMSAPDAPFMFLTDEYNNSLEATNFEFMWLEEWPIECRGIAVAAATALATAVTVDNADIVLPGWIVRVAETGENFQVVSRDLATNILTIRRGFGGAPSAIPAGSHLLYLGNAAEEGQNPVEMLSRGTDNGTLYLQEVLHAVGLTSWEAMAAKRGIGELARLDRQALVRHRQMLEGFGIFGKPGRVLNPTTGKPIYMCAGLLHLCGQHNIVNLGGKFTYDGAAAAFSRIFEFGETKTRYAFTSKRMLMNVCRIPEVRNNVQRMPESTKIGFDITEISWPGGGTVRLVNLPALDEVGVDNQIIVTSLADLRRRYHAKAPGLHIERDIQTKGSLRKEWQMSRIIGFDHLNTLAAGVLTNCG